MFWLFTLLHLLVAAYRDVFRTWLNIYKWTFFAKMFNGFNLLTIFKKRLRCRCSTGLKIGVWLRIGNNELIPSLYIKPRKYLAWKYVWHRFRKNKRSWWNSKQNDCLCRSRRPRVSLKKVLWGISQNSQEISFSESLFW